MIASRYGASDQAGVLKDSDVLGDSSQRYVKQAGQFRNPGSADGEPLKQSPSDWMRNGPVGHVQPGSTIFNHMVELSSFQVIASSDNQVVSKETMARAQEGFSAWRRGDFATLEAILDPDVEWRWFEPGEWDCKSRGDVMRTLRDRYAQGFARGELEFVDGGNDVVIVVAHPAAMGGEGWPDETATLITFREGRVTTMQDYRSKAEALAAGR